MARHFLSIGGNVKDFSGVVDHKSTRFPSVPMQPKQHSPLDSRRTPITIEARTTALSFPGCDTGCTDDVGGGCLDGIAQTPETNRSMMNYMKNPSTAPFAVGDVIDVVQLSRFTTMDKIHWRVERPIAPFTFDLQIAELKDDGSIATVSLLDKYLPDGSVSVAAGTAITPLILAADLSGEVQHWHTISMLNPATLLPYEVRTNEMLQLVIKTMPPNPTPDTCGGCCACGGLSGLGLVITPVMTSYDTGIDDQ